MESAFTKANISQVALFPWGGIACTNLLTPSSCFQGKARDQHTNVPETNKSRETYAQNLPWSACNWTRFPKTPVDNTSFP
jgi:hypothetical protein